MFTMQIHLVFAWMLENIQKKDRMLSLKGLLSPLVRQMNNQV